MTGAEAIARILEAHAADYHLQRLCNGDTWLLTRGRRNSPRTERPGITVAEMLRLAEIATG